MQNVIVGTGPLGRATAQALLAQGQTVRMVNRSGAMPNPPHQAEIVKADAHDPKSILAATQGAKTVFNCLAPNYSAKAWREELPVLWGNVLAAAATHHAKLIVGDNLYMYDQIGTNIHENLPMQASTQKGQARIVVVQQHLEAQRKGQVQVAFVRGSDFFGPYANEQSHFGGRIFAAMLQGKAAQIVGNPDTPHTMTYIQDFGKAMALVAGQEDTFGQAWHVPNAPARSRREALTLIAEMLKQPLKFQGMNKTAVQVLGLFMPALREVTEMMYQFERPYTVNHQKFVARFGDIHTPLETALEATLAWFRANAK